MFWKVVASWCLGMQWKVAASWCLGMHLLSTLRLTKHALVLRNLLQASTFLQVIVAAAARSIRYKSKRDDASLMQSQKTLHLCLVRVRLKEHDNLQHWLSFCTQTHTGVAQTAWSWALTYAIRHAFRNRDQGLRKIIEHLSRISVRE